MARKGRKTAVLTIRLIRGGRYCAANKLRYADSYEIWLNGKRIGKRQPFPKLIKRAAERRVFLQAYGDSVVKKINRKLEQRRQARRERARFKRVEKRVEGRTTPRKLRDKDYEEYLELERRIATEIIDVDNVHPERAQTLPNATVEDVTIFPIIPPGDYYTKRIIEKLITSPLHKTGRLNLSIMDFDLVDQDYWIPVDEQTVGEAAARATQILVPHIVDFWKQTHASADSYILRLKFQWEFKVGEYVSHGVSLHRQDIRSLDRLYWVFAKTFAKLGGVGNANPKEKPRNYLANQILIFVSGFTLEAADEDIFKK